MTSTAYSLSGGRNLVLFLLLGTDRRVSQLLQYYLQFQPVQATSESGILVKAGLTFPGLTSRTVTSNVK